MSWSDPLPTSTPLVREGGRRAFGIEAYSDTTFPVSMFIPHA